MLLPCILLSGNTILGQSNYIICLYKRPGIKVLWKLCHTCRLVNPLAENVVGNISYRPFFLEREIV